MHEKIKTGGIFGLLILGVGILLYPTVSNWLAVRNQTVAITHYKEQLSEIDSAKLEQEWEKAVAFNNSLTGLAIEDPFIPESGMVVPENYEEVLNVNEVMGYVEVPKIDIKLPIYHGSSEEVLQKGVGHLQATALPIGTVGGHCVLSGHRGLPSAKLFTDLDKIKEGDVFYLYVLDKILAYEVDQIKVVEPSNTEDLLPVKDKDYVSLVTCTPYGVNSHRLLVRGSRIPYEEEVEKVEEIKKSKDSSKFSWVLIVAGIVLALVCGVMIYFIRKRVITRRRKGDRHEEK